MNQPCYVCGHTSEELSRLDLQGALYHDVTRELLVAAGLKSGMRVLDLGCGSGDVTFLAAELVGPDGLVIGVDRAPEAIAAARVRAAARGLAQVTFRLGDEERWPGQAADALVGRFVLMHQAQPAVALRAALRDLRPGGVVAFLESQMDALVPGVHSMPHSPLYDAIVRTQREVLRAAGAHTDMGLRLRETFVGAGLPGPALCLQARAEGGPDAPIYRYAAASLRSMLPLARRLGIPAPVAGDQGIEDLEHRLRAEVIACGGVLMAPPVVGGWCRAP